MPEQLKAVPEIDKERLDGFTLAVRELIKHENDLVNHRIGWFVQTQGLLFAALAFGWKTAPQLPYILAAVGIATAISTASAIAFYSPTVRGLEDLWNQLVPENERKYRLIIGAGRVGRGGGGGRARSKGLAKLLRPWKALPFIFIATWVAVIITRFLVRSN